MTVTTYNAKLAPGYYASIKWDKHSPQILTAEIRPMLSDCESGHPICSKSLLYNAANERRLAAFIDRKAASMGLAVHGSFNQYSLQAKGKQSLPYNPPMSVEAGAAFVLKQLSPADIAYARDEARGEFRGFAALHDLCDANMLLPGAEDFNGSDAETNYFNSVMEAVSAQILATVPA